MKSDEFDLKKDIEYGTSPGVNTFRNNRIMALNATSLGLLRQQIIDSLGIEEARKTLFRFGFQSGYTDFLHIDKNYTFDNEEELLRAGPKIHTDKGIVAAESDEMSFDREADEFYFAGTWHNSYEAEQHLAHNGESEFPVCWSLIGYASAWCSGFAKLPVLAQETACVAEGSDVCKWEVKPISEWGQEVDLYVDALKDLFMGEKLMEYYSYIQEKEGRSGKIELAKATKMPETKASTSTDSKENIEMFRDAIEEIIGERPPQL